MTKPQGRGTTKKLKVKKDTVKNLSVKKSGGVKGGAGSGAFCHRVGGTGGATIVPASIITPSGICWR